MKNEEIQERRNVRTGRCRNWWMDGLCMTGGMNGWNNGVTEAQRDREDQRKGGLDEYI